MTSRSRIVWALATVALFASAQEQKREEPMCNDPWGTCKLPVKFVSEEHGCYVYACSYGTRDEHLVRVKDDEGVKQLNALFRRTQEQDLQQRRNATRNEK